MNIVRFLSFVLLASSFLLGQSSTPGNGSTGDTKPIADQIKALQAAIAEQQKQIEALRQQLQEQKKSAPQVVNASLNTTGAANANAVQADVQKPKESPLSFRIGGTEFTPGGFVDFENVFRTTNSGSQVSTNFGTIPFSNQPQGHLTEYRLTAQYSRFNMKITGKYGANDITGFVEADFNGNSPASVFQTSGTFAPRLRQAFLNLKRGDWEIMGGQSWGLQTPNRNGISPSSLAITLNEDSNIQVGIPFSRAALFRVAWHPSKNFVWAGEVQNSQQFTNGEVAFPEEFTATLNRQFDPNGGPNIPNLIPDFLTKLAWDTSGGHHLHFEVGGMLTSVKVAVQPTGSLTFNTHSKIGGGILGAVNFELTKKIRVLANGLYGPGVGRYTIGQGPAAVVAPVALTPTVFDVAPSMVHSGTGTIGIEIQARPKTQIAAYYGGSYFRRNFFQDITSTMAPQPFIGFGGPGSGTSNNRSIQEGTLDIVQTFWKHPQYGAVVLVNQASYLTRSPWFVATTPVPAPKNAHLFMDYLSLKYVLP